MKYKLNKKLGQHFLFDDIILSRIANSIDVAENKKIVEIGPGAGSLTKHLLTKNVPLISVELDKRWANEVKNKFSEHPNFKVLHQDALKLEWDELGKENQLIVVGNIPYQITSPLLFNIIKNRHLISDCVFLMQKEVAERIAAVHGNKKFGILSIAVQYFFKAEILFEVPPEAFTPPPKVYSSVLKLKKIEPASEGIEDWDDFMSFIHQMFNQRRKMIRNSLKSWLESCENNEAVDEYLTKRPEQLSIKQLISFYKVLIKKV
ncbi:MAG: ribosomal RNA small subunit methyltransferase A [Calditrichia bacterium]|nr:ribosomal RNA small subunit methyltransferase A [Calditrichia bacterium]